MLRPRPLFESWQKFAMATGGKDSSVRVKVEPVSSPLASAAALAKFATNVKKELGGGRLASFKPPRDLSLSGVSSHLSANSSLSSHGTTRKTYTPNFNVVRRKGQISISSADSGRNESKPAQERTRRPRNKPNFIQTTSVFSAGLAPGRLKDHSREKEDKSPQIEKPKLNLTKNVSKKKEESKMKDIMKDDFIDDPSVMPDLNDCPKSLPLLINVKQHTSRNLDDTFESLQLKTEKYENIKAEELHGRTTALNQFFSDSSTSKLFVMDFPNEISVVEDSRKSTKESKNEQTSKTDTNLRPPATHRLSNLGEGRWGTLKVLANGAAYILVGNERIPVMLTRHCPRQMVMSVTLDTTCSTGELVNMGNVDATLMCFSDVSPKP